MTHRADESAPVDDGDVLGAEICNHDSLRRLLSLSPVTLHSMCSAASERASKKLTQFLQRDAVREVLLGQLPGRQEPPSAAGRAEREAHKVSSKHARARAHKTTPPEPPSCEQASCALV